MTGPEHYRKAEEHLEHARTGRGDATWDQRQAQAHFTAALVAATVEVRLLSHDLPRDSFDEWVEAIR